MTLTIGLKRPRNDAVAAITSRFGIRRHTVRSGFKAGLPVIATRAQIAAAIWCSPPDVARALSEFGKVELITNVNDRRVNRRPAKWQINKPSHVTPANNLFIVGGTSHALDVSRVIPLLKNVFKHTIKTPFEDALPSDTARIFNVRVQEMRLPRVRERTEPRRTRLKGLDGLGEWNALLGRFAQSPFLRGEDANGCTTCEIAALNAARIAGKTDAEIRTLVAKPEATRNAVEQG